MKVVCRICGREFSTLNSHMHRSHGITIKEYKEMYPGERTCSEEFLALQSKAMSRRNSNLEFSEHVSKRNKDNWGKSSYRESMVLSMIKTRNYSIKGKHYSLKCESFVAYKSDSELEYAKKLDNDPHVVKYDSESFVIWYDHCGQDKMYIPDFIVYLDDGRVQVVEIKPEYHHGAHDDLLVDKYRSARDYCKSHDYEFVIVNG